jgi:hypothetical protein
MPVYYFDVWEGTGLKVDDHGTDLQPEQLSTEIRRVLVEMGGHPLGNGTTTELRIVVRDGQKPIMRGRLSLELENVN